MRSETKSTLTCYICCSILLEIIPWRSRRKRQHITVVSNFRNVQSTIKFITLLSGFFFYRELHLFINLPNLQQTSGIQMKLWNHLKLHKHEWLHKHNLNTFKYNKKTGYILNRCTVVADISGLSKKTGKRIKMKSKRKSK